MDELRPIEVDFETWKLIQNELRSFSEPPHLALRRLLKLPEETHKPEAKQPTLVGRAWTGDGVTLAHGTKLRMDYNQRRYEGEIVDGQWIVEGAAYSSPSGAASGAAVTKSGDKTKLDGWGYWEVKQPGDTGWTALRNLRRSKGKFI